MQLEVSVEPIDVYGQTITGIDVTTDRIPAGNGVTPKRSPLPLARRADNPADISRLDKLRLHVVSVSEATGELRSDQYFYFDNLRLKLKGQVIGDFN